MAHVCVPEPALCPQQKSFCLLPLFPGLFSVDTLTVPKLHLLLVTHKHLEVLELSLQAEFWLMNLNYFFLIPLTSLESL